MGEQEPPKPWNRTRLPFDDKPMSVLAGAAQRGAGIFYAILALSLVGLALYMGMVKQAPLMGPWVVAPAIGAAWFALRAFMALTPRK